VPSPLTDQVAIVTGASSGIGAATAHELARRGARVVLAARRERELKAQVLAIRGGGGKAIAIPADVTDVVQVIRLIECARQEFGPVDVLVNNAGSNWMKPLAETSPDEINRLLQVNLLGAMVATNAVLPEMQQRGHGAVITVGSVASHVAIEPLYSATKFGVRGFSLALRRQLAGSGVSVSLVTPGNIRTRMTSGLRERMPEPTLVATAIADLILNPRRELVIPRKYHAIIWFDRLFPGIADSIFYRRHGQGNREGDSNMPAYVLAAEMKEKCNGNDGYRSHGAGRTPPRHGTAGTR
jgi:NAD(P)-dependent dehydrogenase (short-subunit alcohol dehydrogenase family)